MGWIFGSVSALLVAACVGAGAQRAERGAPEGKARVSTPAGAPTASGHVSPVETATSGAGSQGGSPAERLAFDSSRAWEHLRQQVAIGPRPAGSAASLQTRRYILQQLREAGIEAREQPFDAQTPIGPMKMANIVATIPGRRPERIALGSHYDTKRYRGFRFVGASDGASSTAALIELGRVLSRRSNAFTIELLFFDGEEAVREHVWADDDHTYGSRFYVENARQAGTLAGLKALILLDMIGDRDLRIRRESNSTRWLTDIIWAAAARLGYGRYFVDEQFAMGGDDHFPFLAAGIPAVDIIDFEYPAWHTADDTLDAVSARSLQIVGEVVLAALPRIEKRLSSR